MDKWMPPDILLRFSFANSLESISFYIFVMHRKCFLDRQNVCNTDTHDRLFTIALVLCLIT